MFDHKLFATEMAGMVKEFTERAIQPVLARLAVLEAHQPQDGKPGQDAEPDVTASIVIFRLKPEIEEIRAAVAGQPAKIEADIARAIAAIPVPKDGASGQDGKSVTVEDIAPLLAAEVAKIPAAKDGAPGQNGEPGIDGKSVSIEEIKPLIAAEIAALPKPKDGQDGKPGKDGLALASALIDREGNLIFTASDGSTKELGRIVGKDGSDGAPGKSTEPDSLLAPDDIATRIADAVKMMAETASAVQPAEAGGYGERQLPVSIFLPGVDKPETVVKVALPPQQAPVVHVAAPAVTNIVSVPEPRKRHIHTTVKRHDEKGRLAEFDQEEL